MRRRKSTPADGPATASSEQNGTPSEKSPFEVVEARMRLSLPPSCLKDVQLAIEHKLRAMVMSFDEDLDGVVVAFRGVDLLDESASIVNELPTLHCDVDAEFLVFRPVSGMILEGRVNKVSRSHVGMLVFDVINASVAADAIPDTYSFIEEEEAWRDSKSGEDIHVGRTVRFTHQRLHEAGGMISLFGSLREAGTGPTDHPVKVPPTLELLRSTATAATEAVSPGMAEAAEQPRRKRKRPMGGEESENDGEDAGVAAEGAAAGPGAAEGVGSGAEHEEEAKERKDKKSKKDKKVKKDKKDKHEKKKRRKE